VAKQLLKDVELPVPPHLRAIDFTDVGQYVNVYVHPQRTNAHTHTHHRKRRTTRVAPPRTPEPIDGRRHIDIQTDTYLEELTDTVPEADNQTQTDAFLDRPPTPIFVPQKSGVDVTTQIENGGYSG